MSAKQYKKQDAAEIRFLAGPGTNEKLVAIKEWGEYRSRAETIRNLIAEKYYELLRKNEVKKWR